MKLGNEGNHEKKRGEIRERERKEERERGKV